ncbi:MAG: hypothetical protein ABI811_02635 [Acidobacteriota bacterium]
MRTNKFILLVAMLGGLAVQHASAADLVVIAHPDLQISSITIEELRGVFLGVRTSLKNAGPVQPILKTSSAELTRFSAEYLGKSEAALRTYYRSLVFTGKWSVPVTLNSDAEVIAYVARTRGAVGFIEATSITPGVKILKVTKGP